MNHAVIFSLKSPGNKMQKIFTAIMLAALCSILFHSNALAAITPFYGEFDGTEPVADMYAAGHYYAYIVIGPVEVTQTGDYRYGDLLFSCDVDIILGIFQGGFNPADPTANRLTYCDDSDIITLTAGVDYYLVVHPLDYTNITIGKWCFVLEGAGLVKGGTSLWSRVWTGDFNGTEPDADIYGCGGNYAYDVIGPVRFDHTGDYTYGDITVYYDVDMSLTIFEGDFNPAEPDTNRVGAFDDCGTVTLTAGVDYYLVVQPLCDDYRGEWKFILLNESPALPVPALSRWGLGLLSLFLAIAAIGMIKRKTNRRIAE